MVVLTEQQKRMAEELVNRARNKTTITIMNLGNMVGIGRRQVGKNVGLISEKCKELGLPMLSVLVVKKSDGITASGFLNHFFPNVTDEAEKTKILRENMEKAYNQKDWSALLNWSYYENIYPDEETIGFVGVDGKKKTVTTTYYERNPKLRRACIEKYGVKCYICGFDAAEKYGEQFKGKIHIHHKIPVHLNGECVISEDDLVPVCPNCHMILHSKGKNECYTVEEVKAMWNR